MAEISVEKKLLEEIHKLKEEQQRKVLEFARLLTKPKVEGIPGKSLLRFAGTIDKTDLQEMAQAIAEDCERVNPHEW